MWARYCTGVTSQINFILLFFFGCHVAKFLNVWVSGSKKINVAYTIRDIMSLPGLGPIGLIIVLTFTVC